MKAASRARRVKKKKEKKTVLLGYQLPICIVIWAPNSKSVPAQPEFARKSIYK